MRTTFDALNLRRIESNEVRLRLMPPGWALESSCVQDLMRDYADIADWMTGYYGEHGREAMGHECYAYAVNLADALGAAICKALRHRVKSAQGLETY